MNVAQPARFVAVGAAGYAVNLLAFAALYAVGTPYAAASVVAYLVSNVLMYLGNRYFTFRLGHRGFWRAYVRYLLVGLLVAGLTAAVLAFFVEALGLHPTVGQALALLVVMPVAFVLIKRWTFQLREPRLRNRRACFSVSSLCRAASARNRLTNRRSERELES